MEMDDARTPLVNGNGNTTRASSDDKDGDMPSPKRLKRQKSEQEAEEEESDDEPVVKKRKRSSAKAPSKSAVRTVTPKASLKQQNQSNQQHKVKASQESAKPKMAKKELVEESSPQKEEPESGSESEAVSASEDENSEAAAKKRAKVQSTLKSTTNDPYPDWKVGDPVPYAALCATFSLIEMTTKRLIIASHCSLFLRQVLRLTPQDLLPTVQLMINKLAADYAGIELGIGESLIMKAIGETTGRSLKDIKADQNKLGDLGLVAAKSRSNQSLMFKPKPLTVRGVHQGLLAVAKMSGHGAQDQKVGGIKKLLSAADLTFLEKGNKGVDITKDKGGPSESKFLIRFLEGKLRLGLAEKTVLPSLAQAMVFYELDQNGKTPSTEQLAKGESIIKAVFSELPSYEVIIPTMLEHGIFHLRENCKLQPGVPLKPMLAKPTKSITEVLDRFEGKDFTCEYKYDGERAQIHYVAPDSIDQFGAAQDTLKKVETKGLSSIFSRNSEDLSNKYPDILARLGTWIKSDTKSFVLDCETVAWDVAQKKVLPFQQLMTRKRKDVKVEDVKVKVCVFAFDLLFLNGEATVNKTLRERRELLQSAFNPVEGEFSFAQYGNTRDIEEIQTLLDESVKASCEGLMVKMLDTEESGYEPSKRSRNWLKVKKDYLSGVGDSLDLVVLGAYYGKGKRTSVYGAFLLAAYNATEQNYETVCNIGTGFSEAILEELHNQLSEIVIDKPKPFYSHSNVPKDQPDVWFEPRYVWEVKTADLTLSPRYKAAADEMPGGKGVSLRFPRFLKVREDKKTEEATNVRQVAELYRAQEAVTKGEATKGGVDDDFEY